MIWNRKKLANSNFLYCSSCASGIRCYSDVFLNKHNSPDFVIRSRRHFLAHTQEIPHVRFSLTRLPALFESVVPQWKYLRYITQRHIKEVATVSTGRNAADVPQSVNFNWPIFLEYA